MVEYLLNKCGTPSLILNMRKKQNKQKTINGWRKGISKAFQGFVMPASDTRKWSAVQKKNSNLQEIDNWMGTERTKKGSLPKQPGWKEDTETELQMLQPSTTVVADAHNGKMTTDEIFSDLRFLVAKIEFQSSR